jgi:hypothetical protein
MPKTDSRQDRSSIFEGRIGLLTISGAKPTVRREIDDHLTPK